MVSHKRLTKEEVLQNVHNGWQLVQAPSDRGNWRLVKDGREDVEAPKWSVRALVREGLLPS